MAYVGGSPFMATDPSGMVLVVHKWTGQCYDLQPSSTGDWSEVNGRLEYTPGRGIWNFTPVACPGSGLSSGDSTGGVAGSSTGDYSQPQAPNPKKNCVSMKYSISSGKLVVKTGAATGPQYLVMDATSGRGSSMNNPGDINLFKVGPIPPGSYSLNPSEISTGLMWSLTRNMKGDWGSFRVPLHPQFDLPDGRTGGFFLHGGSIPGSAGCIDCGGGLFGNDNTKALLDILNSADGAVPCEVTR